MDMTLSRLQPRRLDRWSRQLAFSLLEQLQGAKLTI